VEQGVFDLILNWNPSENFSSYINYTYVWTDEATGPYEGGSDPSGWGISAAGRYAFTDRLGLALRAEWVEDTHALWALGENQFFPPGFPIGDIDNNTENEIWGITGTVDYELTDNLVVKSEIRYDHVSCIKSSGGGCGGSAGFPGSSGPDARRSQWLAGVEAVYNF
ncbi:MAG: outer membrane beta-barrel protein, partial [Deltaproteobacteria bacterium]|nr:outer membrane beta-barrel protein [Deltaproteobacteria bacterium]